MESSPFRCYATSLNDDVFSNDTGVRITVVSAPTPVCRDAFVHKRYSRSAAEKFTAEVFLNLVNADTLLSHGVTLTNRHGVILKGIEVDGDAERGTNLVLTAVALANSLHRRSQHSNAHVNEQQDRGPSATSQNYGSVAAPQP